MTSTQRIWFVTGSSRGIGRAWVEAALERGDRVAATARHASDLDDLVTEHGDAVLALTLDVTDRAAVHATVRRAHGHFGRLDVVVNNAGIGHVGVIEAQPEADVRRQFETNFFGAVWVTQAVLPLLREQGSGHIVQMSTMGGHLGHASLGLYHASKWALEGFTESLALEVSGLGIRTTLVEPGAVATEWFPRCTTSSEPSAYADALADRWGGFDPADMPAPDVVVAAAMRAVDAAEPPARLLVGNQAYDLVTSTYRDRLAGFAQWEDISRAAIAAR